MTTKIKLLFSAFFCVLTSTLTSQNYTVSGKIVDVDQQPISYVNIILQQVLNEKGSIEPIGTSTNDDGTFRFENLTPGTYNIMTSFIGFESYKASITVNEDIQLPAITIKESPETLDQITITARQPTITRQPDRLIFNVENTALSEGSVFGVLKNTPGVIVSNLGINIKSSKATVYINNRRVQLSEEELIALLESSSANSIKSVEVITNPPASYDADSGPVVNIIMSRNLIAGYKGSVYSNYTQGVFPRYTLGTSHFLKNDKINFNINYNYTNQKINRESDEIINFLDDNNNSTEVWRSDIDRNIWSENHNLNLSFDYYIDPDNTLSITSSGLYTPYAKYRINNNTVIRDENAIFLSRFTSAGLSGNEKYNIGSDVSFKHSINDHSSLRLNGHYTVYNYEYNQNVFSRFFDVNDIFENDSEFNTLASQNTEIMAAKADYNSSVGDNTDIDLGAKLSNITTDSDIKREDIINGTSVLNDENTDTFKYDEMVYAGYANVKTSLGKWDLNVGMRIEHTKVEGVSLTTNTTNTQEYTNWFPNASISYKAKDELLIYGNYKRNISRPSYTDLNPFTFFINENTIALGNPNLVPTYIDHYKVGVNFLKHFTFEAYYIDYDGQISEIPRQDNTTNIIAFTPVNLDRTVDYGFDFIVDFYINDRWSLYSVFSIYNITQKANFGSDFVEFSRWSTYGDLSTNYTLLKDNSLNVNLTAYWVQKSLINLSIVEDRLFSSLSISKSILKKRGVISLTIEDILNFQNENSRIQYLNQSYSKYADIDNRYIKLGFRYKFGNTKLSARERTLEAEERERIKDLNN